MYCMPYTHLACLLCSISIQLSSSVVYCEKYLNCIAIYLHVVYISNQREKQKVTWSVITLKNAFDVHDGVVSFIHSAVIARAESVAASLS